MSTESLLIIDAIGPFFDSTSPNESTGPKIPFTHLENHEGLKPKFLATIADDFLVFCKSAKRQGYNAITLDDVAHLVSDDSYDDALLRKIDQYRGTLRKPHRDCDEIGTARFLYDGRNVLQ